MVVAAIGVPVSFLAGLFLSHERYVEQTGAGVGTEVSAVRRLAAPALAVVCAQVIDAAVSGDRNLALQALLLDPMMNDIERAKAILDDFVISFRQWLPQFA